MELIDYYPFGEVRLDEQNNDYENNYKYTGKELDKDTGLYYYGARYYDAGIGRFVSVDPLVRNVSIKQLINPQGLNSYSYTLNNPLKYVDPDGRNPALFLAAGIWVIYGALTRPQPVGDNAGRVDSNIEQTVKIGADIAVGETIGKAVGYIGGKIFGKVAKFFKAGERSAGKYPLLKEADETGKILNLQKTADGKIRYFKNGQRRTPKETYDFILKDGKLKFGENHSYLSRGEPVDYAGQIKFDKKGNVKSWNNNSGHCQPSIDDTRAINRTKDAFKQQYGVQLPRITPN